MTSPLYGGPRRTLLVVALALAGITATLRADRSSEARANRLHRSDQLTEAAAIYIERLERDSNAARLHYNLGTTLLRIGSPSAYAELAAGSESDSERLRVLAYYNAGLWSLIQALFAQSNDSIFYHARNAIEANKAALRLNPDHPDAPWNLALAQLMTVTASPEEGPGNSETPDNSPDIDGLQLSDDLQELDEEEPIEEEPGEGADEALADGDELEPLSIQEASQIVGSGHLDASTMVGKLLYRESRSRRRRNIGVTGPPW